MQKRVIIFEDDTTSREMLTAILKKQGYEVVSAADPKLCPISAQQGGTCPGDHTCCDFLLTDNRMPYIAGLDFIEAQGQAGCTGSSQHNAVISASWSAGDRERAERLNCKTFDKPYSILELTTWLSAQEKLISPDRQLVALNAVADTQDPI